jgi:hypothetical protein
MEQNNRQVLEELITAGDPYTIATLIVANKVSDIPEEELREFLTRAFSAAAHLERQSKELPGEGFADSEGGGLARQLDTMALDLHYNPGGLPLIDQIYLFYPRLKPASKDTLSN